MVPWSAVPTGQPASAPGNSLVFPQWLLLTFSPHSLQQPADHALLLATLPDIVPWLCPASGCSTSKTSLCFGGAEGQQVARQYQGIEASGAFQLLLMPQGTPAVWLCQYQGTVWGLGFLPYKVGLGEAISVSSTLPEAKVRIQGDREGVGERAAGSTRQNSFQRVC